MGRGRRRRRRGGLPERVVSGDAAECNFRDVCAPGVRAGCGRGSRGTGAESVRWGAAMGGVARGSCVCVRARACVYTTAEGYSLTNS